MQRHTMHDDFADFIHREPGGRTIDELAERFEQSHSFTPEYDAAARRKQVKADIRKAINEDRDADGMPRLQSVLRTDPQTGKPRPVYVQTSMFEVDDFKRQWRSADRQERRGREKKERLERDFGAAFPDEKPLRQQMLPFPRDNGAGGHAA